MKKSSFHSLAFGIAFVGFITQFGGGFASGAQIYQYFVNYGIWALATPIVAQGIMALAYAYGMKFALKNQVFDYRSFSDRFYGKTRFIFSNLYELEYLVMVCLAPAVAFATGGSVLRALTGMPYLLSTLLIGLAIFLVTLFGTDLVRKTSSILSVLVIAGLLVVLVPNIIVQRATILAALGNLANGVMPVGSVATGGFASALNRGLVYGIFQLTAIGLMYPHVRKVRSERQINRSMVYMFLINTLVMELAIVGLLAVAYLPELAEVSVPMLLLVQKGVGARFLTPLISVLVILGSVSTGVTMIAGIVERTVKQVEKKRSASPVHRILGALVFTALAFAVAQFGLIPLVAVGYSYIGYATLFVIVIPFTVHFLLGKIRKEASNEIG